MMTNLVPTVLFVCTGNAARSVMAAAMLRAATNAVQIASAGTHSIPGLPMSARTRTALAGFDVVDKQHLSAQLEQTMVDQASVIAIFEPMHLSYMRKKHPDASSKVASLPRLARDLAAGAADTLDHRLAALALEGHVFEGWEEVIDPAGGDLPVFENSAAEIHALIATFSAKIAAETCAGT
jgi:protein-tyrosine-phosphatase